MQLKGKEAQVIQLRQENIRYQPNTLSKMN